MGDDAAHLAGDHPQHLAPLGDLDPHQLLDGQGETHVVGHGGEVVGAVGERDDLVVLAVLAELLEPGVQVADVGDAALDRLALELDHQPEHPVGGGVLRADVHQHVLPAQVLPAAGHAEGHAHRAPGGVEPRRGQLELHGPAGHATSPWCPSASRWRMSAGR
jgi:hypothetical protein